MSGERTRCGFVSVLGLPNAGKSTLVNTLVGSKVSIVSRKVQTTRTRVLGIVLHENAQVILIDTPGIFAPKKTLDKAMVAAAWDSASEADILVHLVDASRRETLEENRIIFEKLPAGKPCVLALNKTDRVRKEELLALSAALNGAFGYAATFMISGLKGDGVGDLTSYLAAHLPEGPYLFPEDQISDMPMRLLAAEITREKIYDRLHQELPYAVMVETENWEKFDNGSVKIDQAVVVDRDSQKGIVLGKGGAQIKAIGQAAREELETILETRVHLKLFVKVQKNWADKAEFYKAIGLEWPG